MVHGSGQFKHAKKQLFLRRCTIPIGAGMFEFLSAVKPYQHVGTFLAVSRDASEEVPKRSCDIRNESSYLCVLVLNVSSISDIGKLL